MIQTIYTRGICIYTSSSQEIFLPQVHGPIPQVKCNYTNKLQICSRYGKRATTAIPRVKLVYTRGRKPKNRLRLRTQLYPLLFSFFFLPCSRRVVICASEICSTIFRPRLTTGRYQVTLIRT
jgi:hypothetical protein